MAKIMQVKAPRVGSVIEFNLGDYFVYGVTVKVDPVEGDSLLMFAPKIKTALLEVKSVIGLQVRNKFLFFTKLINTKQLKGSARAVSMLQGDDLPKDDGMFRLYTGSYPSPKGLLKGKWQVISEGARAIHSTASEEIGRMSDASVPNLPYIKHYFDEDYYPWSAPLTGRGMTSFDPLDFEAKNRVALPADNSHQ